MDDGWTPRADPGPGVLSEVPDLAPLVRAALRKRVPPAMRGGRLHLSWTAVAALAIVVALAVVGGAVLVLHGRAGPVAADQPLPVSSDFSPASSSGAAPAPVAEIVIEVVGRVHHAGVFTLPTGSRFVDALKAAGGVLPGTDTTSLGLAQKLTDGQQVRVGIGGVAPGPAPGATGGTGGTASGPVDLNTATETQLDALPGVGPVLAQRILDYRNAHGSFSSVNDLKGVQGLGGKKGDDLVALVTVG